MNKDEAFEKVKKLLALSENNPSESEANAALLKAQAMMAEYNISLEVVTEEKHQSTVVVCNHKWDYGFRKPLGHVIANNFRCEVFISGNSIAFMGHDLDARIAKQAFEYAYDFAVREGNKHYNKAYQLGKHTKGIFNSYTTGFIMGLKTKLEEQCVALMIVTPPDVKSDFEEMTSGEGWKTKKSRPMESVNRDVYNEGFKDGKKVLETNKLSEAH